MTLSDTLAGKIGPGLRWVPLETIKTWQMQLFQKGKFSLNLASKAVLRMGALTGASSSNLPKIPGTCALKEVNVNRKVVQKVHMSGMEKGESGKGTVDGKEDEQGWDKVKKGGRVEKFSPRTLEKLAKAKAEIVQREKVEKSKEYAAKKMEIRKEGESEDMVVESPERKFTKDSSCRQLSWEDTPPSSPCGSAGVDSASLKSGGRQDMPILQPVEVPRKPRSKSSRKKKLGRRARIWVIMKGGILTGFEKNKGSLLKTPETVFSGKMQGYANSPLMQMEKDAKDLALVVTSPGVTHCSEVAMEEVEKTQDCTMEERKVRGNSDIVLDGSFMVGDRPVLGFLNVIIDVKFGGETAVILEHFDEFMRSPNFMLYKDKPFLNQIVERLLFKGVLTGKDNSEVLLYRQVSLIDNTLWAHVRVNPQRAEASAVRGNWSWMKLDEALKNLWIPEQVLPVGQVNAEGFLTASEVLQGFAWSNSDGKELVLDGDSETGGGCVFFPRVVAESSPTGLQGEFLKMVQASEEREQITFGNF